MTADYAPGGAGFALWANTRDLIAALWAVYQA